MWTLTWVEDPADHAGEHHEEHGQQLEVATHDAAGLHVRQVASREAPLHDDLGDNETGRSVPRTDRFELHPVL